MTHQKSSCARYTMARESTRRRQRLQLACIVLTAGYASALSFTLSNFQLISSFSIPLNCIFAYNTPLYHCKISDFTMGNTCSDRCKVSIEKAERNIQASCQSVDASRHTLLYESQKGELLGVLCKDEDKPEATLTVVQPVTSTARLTASQMTTIRTSAIASSKPLSKDLTTTILITMTSEGTTIAQPATSSETTSGTTSDYPTETLTLTTTQRDDPSQTSATTNTQAPEAGDEVPSSTESATRRQTVLPGSGGGSPFDFVASGHTMRPPSITHAVGILATLVCAMLMR